MKNISDGSVYSNTEYLSPTEVPSSSSETPTSTLQTGTSLTSPATEFKVKNLLMARPFQKKHANVEPIIPISRQSPQSSSTPAPSPKDDFDEIIKNTPPQPRKFFKSKDSPFYTAGPAVKKEQNEPDRSSSPTGTPAKKMKQEQTLE